MKNPKHIILIAGEASGDLHGARLIESLKKLDPALTFAGIGGPLMRGQGMVLYEDLTQMAVVGFIEVLKHYQSFKKIFDTILVKIETVRPDAVVLIDYPGFNLRLARAIKQKGIKTKIIFYISPQVWAWKESRTKLIQKVVDKMLVILPFEKEFYAKRGVSVEFVGHPLLDSIKITKNREEFLTAIGLSERNYTIALLPGSREQEVLKLLPLMIKAGEILYQKNCRLQFLLIKAPTISAEMAQKCLKGTTLPVKIVLFENYNAINASQICMVASGTATLETAILQKPMVIIYKTSLLTWMLAKMIIKIPCIGLVNIVAGKKIVEELVQFDATPQNIANEIESLCTNEPKIAEIKSELKKVRELLGTPGASNKAAEIIMKEIH